MSVNLVPMGTVVPGVALEKLSRAPLAIVKPPLEVSKSAATLSDVVDFYNGRFGIGLQPVGVLRVREHDCTVACHVGMCDVETDMCIDVGDVWFVAKPGDDVDGF